MADPQVYMLFCEDVREEAGSKISLMGVLGPKISLENSEAQTGRLKSLVIGAQCRFFDTKDVAGEFEVRFVSGLDDIELPPPPGIAPLQLKPAADRPGMYTSGSCNACTEVLLSDVAFTFRQLKQELLKNSAGHVQVSNRSNSAPI